MLILLFYKQEFSFLEIKINRIFIFGWETILIDAAKMPITLKIRNSEYIYFKGKGGEAWASPLKVLHLEIEAGNITLQRVMVMVMVMRWENPPLLKLTLNSAAKCLSIPYDMTQFLFLPLKNNTYLYDMVTYQKWRSRNQYWLSTCTLARGHGSEREMAPFFSESLASSQVNTIKKRRSSINHIIKQNINPSIWETLIFEKGLGSTYLSGEKKKKEKSTFLLGDKKKKKNPRFPTTFLEPNARWIVVHQPMFSHSFLEPNCRLSSAKDHGSMLPSSRKMWKNLGQPIFHLVQHHPKTLWCIVTHKSVLRFFGR